MPVDAQLATFLQKIKVPVGAAAPVTEKPMVAVMHDAVLRYEDLMQNAGKTGILTGIEAFDSDTGGLKAGQMVVISGQTNAGKTTVALNIANHALKEGIGVALFTIEMDRAEIADVLVSLNGLVNRNCFNTGRFNDAEMEKLLGAVTNLKELPLWIEDAAVQSVEQMSTRLKGLVAMFGVKLAIVDYAQIVQEKNSRDSREQQVSAIATDLRVMGKETGVALIVISQLNEEGKLRESRVLGHAAHTVLDVSQEDGGLTIKVQKGRAIAKKDYPVIYEPLYCRIKSEKKVSDDDAQRSMDYSKVTG